MVYERGCLKKINGVAMEPATEQRVVTLAFRSVTCKKICNDLNELNGITFSHLTRLGFIELCTVSISDLLLQI